MKRSFERYVEKERQKEIDKTGILGYCSCCGAANYVSTGQKHDKECIWFVKEIIDEGS